MSTTQRAWLGFIATVLLGGCAVDPGGDEPIGNAESLLVTDNAIIPNAIIPNAIIPNAIIPNAIIPNALTPGTIDAASLAAIQDPGTGGYLSRMFLKYVVGCALDPTQSFAFSWTDSTNTVHQETYWGILGIAPTWATQPLTDDTRQRLVSGCLAGRTNYLGVSVTISMRSHLDPLRTIVKSDEIAAYSHIEGAFWGNLFIASPYLNACVNTANAAISQADQRYCATGYVDPYGQVQSCGPIVRQGDCQALCGAPNGAGQFYVSCIDKPGQQGGNTTDAVITTALP